jgi:hypothetical protein
MSKQAEKIKAFAFIGACVVLGPLFAYLSTTGAGLSDDTRATDIADGMTQDEKLDAKAQREVEMKDHVIDRLLAENDPLPQASASQEAEPETVSSPTPEAEPSPTPTAEAQPEPSASAPCRPYEIQQNLRGCGAQAQSQPPPPPPQRVASVESQRVPDSAPPSEKNQHPALLWKELMGKRSEPIVGRQNTYAGNAIKAGCRVIAVMDEQEVRIPANFKHSVTLNVRSPIDDCVLPEVDGIKITGELEYAPGEGGLIGNIIRCSDRNPRRKSVDCKGKGRIQSITGSEVIEATIYDNSNWGIFFESLISVGLTPSIAKLTETAATAKTIFQATSSEMIAGTMTKTLDRIAQKIGSAFNDKEMRLSRTCRIDGRQKPCPVLFVVSFGDDVIL